MKSDTGKKHIVGVDGCKGGWCAVSSIDGNQMVKLYPNIIALTNDYPGASHILIDMPMGLGDQKVSRNLDTALRMKLKPRQSTVFNTPCREALDEDNYQSANAKNKKVTGKGLSIQSWNLVRKIREIDTFLQHNPKWRSRFFESSPELCFCGLNKGNTLLSKKKHRNGIDERVKVLAGTDLFDDRLVSDALEKYKRTEVSIDDVLDAYALCIAGMMGSIDGFEIIENLSSFEDSKQIPMRILFYQA